MKMKMYRVMGSFCVILAMMATMKFGRAQEQNPPDELTLRRIIDEGNWKERNDAIALLKAKGTEEPYRSMIKKWLSSYRGSGFDTSIAYVVAYLQDEEFLALAVEALARIKDKWGWQHCYQSICHLLEATFVEVAYAPVVPVLDSILKTSVPPPPDELSNYDRDLIGLMRVKATAGKALAKQKGHEAVETIRQAQEELFACVRAAQEKFGAHYNNLRLDELLHSINLEHACTIASIAWDEERPKYVKMIQEDDPYKRFFAILVLTHAKDKTTLKYVVPVLDDERPAWVPFSEQTRSYIGPSLERMEPDRDQWGDALCTEGLVWRALPAIELISGLNPVTDESGTITFISDQYLPPGKRGLKWRAKRDAWKQWWKENENKPEYVERE